MTALPGVVLGFVLMLLTGNAIGAVAAWFAGAFGPGWADCGAANRVRGGRQSG